MKPKGIIFDFDGTLFDSMGIWETAGEDFLASVGVTAENNLSEKLKVMSLIRGAEYLKEAYSLNITAKKIMKGINKTVEDFYFFHALPKDNVIPFLKTLQNKGIKMSIATATDRHLIERALKRCNMSDYFENIFTCTEIGRGKDEPDIYDHACRVMGTDKNETVVFEDACHAAQTAKDAGYFVVGIYDKYEKQQEKLKEISDIYYTSYNEILKKGEIL